MDNEEVPRVQDALSYLEKVKSKFALEPNVYCQFLDIMKEFKSESIDTEGVIANVKGLFQGHDDLILGFNQFLPPNYKITIDVDRTAEFDRAVHYVARIRERFADDPQTYEQFLECLHAYSQSKTIDEIYNRIQDLFVGHDDLLEDFHHFLPGAVEPPVKKPRTRSRTKRRVKQQSPQEGGEMTGRKHPRPVSSRTVVFPSGCEPEIQLFERIRSTASKPIYLQLIKLINLYNCEIIQRSELVLLARDLLITAYPAFFEAFRATLGYHEWQETEKTIHDKQNYFAVIRNPVNLLNTAVSPSYRQLPNNVILPTCSHRTALCNEVLNDKFVVCVKGSEDSGDFEVHRKNRYEEELFDCEDMRFELDLVIESNVTTIRALERVRRKLSAMDSEQIQAYHIKKERMLNVLHFRAISRLYGEHGQEILELLFENPLVIIPVILRRMQQKSEEWNMLKQQMKLSWRKVMQANDMKSKDHRSFYFKQQDIRQLKPDVLYSELLAFHESNSQKDKPDFFYTFSDPNIHRDIQKLLHVVCVAQKEGTYAAIGVDTMMKYFILPFLGVSIESYEDIDPEITSLEGNIRHSLEAIKHPTAQLRIKPVFFHTKESKLRSHTRPSNFLFCHSQLFLIFRYYQLLYSRLLQCKEFSAKSNDSDAFYSEFVSLLSSLLVGNIDNDQFEDSCHNLMGSGFFQFSTSDKVCFSLIKAIQSLVCTVKCAQIFSLWHYEQQRSLSDLPSPSSRDSFAHQYLCNCSSVLPDEVSLVQVEFFQDSEELSFTLVPSHRPHTTGVHASDRFSNIIKPVDDEVISEWQKRHNPTFLRRNLKRKEPSVVTRDNLSWHFYANHIGLKAVDESSDVLISKDLHLKATRLKDSHSKKWCESRFIELFPDIELERVESEEVFASHLGTPTEIARETQKQAMFIKQEQMS